MPHRTAKPSKGMGRGGTGLGCYSRVPDGQSHVQPPSRPGPGKVAMVTLEGSCHPTAALPCWLSHAHTGSGPQRGWAFSWCTWLDQRGQRRKPPLQTRTRDSHAEMDTHPKATANAWRNHSNAQVTGAKTLLELHRPRTEQRQLIPRP